MALEKSLNPQDKVILTVAPTGAWPTKENTPYVPTQPKEICEEVLACEKAGASIAHIHVRDDNDKSSMNFDKFKETVDRIRDAGSNIVLNLTTSGDLSASDEDRMRPFMELLPEMASFDAGSMNWLNTSVFLNTPKFLETLGKRMQEYDVKPEIEVFDMGMVYNALYYLKIGVLKAPLHFQVCLGSPGGMTATVENLLYVVRHLPEDCTWGTFGVGRNAVAINYAALALGGGIRVGMEDNVFYGYKKLATSNVQFVERIKRMAGEIERTIATPDETRQILGLTKKV